MEKSILDILKEKGTGFKTPKNYFNTIEHSVETKLTKEGFPVKANFKTPENYFESVEENVFKKLDTKEIPEGYFDAIEDRVFEKLKEEKAPKVIDFTTRFKKVFIPIAVAASLLLLVIFNYNTGNNTEVPTIASAEVDAMIEDDYITLDSYEIAEVFNDVDISDTGNDEDLDMLDYIHGTNIESLLLEN